MEGSTPSGKALKRQVLIQDFKCFFTVIQLASEPGMAGERAPPGPERGAGWRFSARPRK